MPDDAFTQARRRFHHFTFYGFLLCLASTTVATFQHYVLQQPAPYPVLSVPVLLGIAGGSFGIAILATYLTNEIHVNRALMVQYLTPASPAFIVCLPWPAISVVIVPFST